MKILETDNKTVIFYLQYLELNIVQYNQNNH